MSILEIIKKLCLEKGTNIARLEKELGLSRGALYKWDSGSPSTESARKVAEYFNVSVDYLMGKTAFKNGRDLFENWGYPANHFEPSFDFGEVLKNVREKKEISLDEVGKALGITAFDVEEIEEGILPLNYDWAEKYANFLGTTVEHLFFEYLPDEDDDLFVDYSRTEIADYFKGDLKKIREFEKAEREDAMKESTLQRSVINGSIRIPVYARIPAGLPVEATDDIVDYEDIPADMIKGGKEYIGFKVCGDSMYPKYIEGDTVIILKQYEFQSGQDCAVYVNGYDATLKKVIKQEAGILLQPLNPNYEAKFYPYDGHESVSIIGVVVELRRKI